MKTLNKLKPKKQKMLEMRITDKAHAQGTNLDAMSVSKLRFLRRLIRLHYRLLTRPNADILDMLLSCNAQTALVVVELVLRERLETESGGKVVDINRALKNRRIN